jgi:hypothetical protein
MNEVFEKASERRKALHARRQKLVEQLMAVEQELKEIENFFAVAAKFGGEPPPVADDTGVRTPVGVMYPNGAVTVHVAPAAAAAAAFPAKGLLHILGEQTSPADVGGMVAPPGQRMGFGFGMVPPSKRKEIVELTRQIIHERGPMTARRILQYLDAKGVGQQLVSGRDEKARVSYLSAVLSRDPMFVSNREMGGYMLKEEAPSDERLKGPDIDDLLKH